MRRALLWLGILLAGLVLGIGSAVLSLRSSSFGNEIQIGPWTTGRAIGTADADIRTRAIVALRGLLALPASEARYFTARVDSDGRPLTGNCTYAVTGARPDARWWSITLYDRQGWLVPNRPRLHSAGGAALADGAEGFGILVGPDQRRAGSINTGSRAPFELTLRTYRPASTAGPMPAILRGDCAP